MDYQELFFNFLKESIPKETSLPEFIEEKLHVSRDGAYRRIGRRTALTLNEAMLLLHDQKLDLFEFVGMTPGKMIFDHIGIGLQGNSSTSLSYVDLLLSIAPKKFLLMTNSIPIHYLYDFPDLLFFQMFFTAKTMVGDPNLHNVNFSTQHPLKPVFLESLEPVMETLNTIPSTEILWVDAIDSLLNPIMYYWETRQLDNEDTALLLLEELGEFVAHLELIATNGKKIRYGEDWVIDKPPVQLYYTEVPLQDCTAIFTLQNGLMKVLHILNGQSMIATSNAYYCQEVQSLVQSIKEKSSNLTTGGEKLRLQFFNAKRSKIAMAKHKVEIGL